MVNECLVRYRKYKIFLDRHTISPQILADVYNHHYVLPFCYMAVKLSQHRKSPSNHGLLDHWVTFRVTVFVGSLCGVVYITWRLEKNVKHLYALGSSSCFQSSLRTAALWIHTREGAVGIAVFFLMWCLVKKSSNTTMYEGLFLLPKLLDLFFL